jgi:hypothetical protein
MKILRLALAGALLCAVACASNSIPSNAASGLTATQTCNSISTQGTFAPQKMVNSGATSGSWAFSQAINISRTFEFYSEPGYPNNTSWASGTWIVQLKVTAAAASNMTWTATCVIRVNSSGVAQATEGSLTGQTTSLTTTGVKSQSITQSATDSAASATDRICIVMVFTSGASGSKSFTLEAGTVANEFVTAPTVMAATGAASNTTVSAEIAARIKAALRADSATTLSAETPAATNGRLRTVSTAPGISESIATASPWSGKSSVTFSAATGSTQTNFTEAFSFSDPKFATIANGGLITSTSTRVGVTVPNDLMLTDDPTCEVQTGGYTWNFEDYSATAGTGHGWVMIPSLTTSASVTPTICLGKSSVTTYQGGAQGSERDASTQLSFHLPDGTTPSAKDFSANANDGILFNSPGAVAGQIGGGISLIAASSQYVATSSNYTDTTVSMSAWVKLAAYPSSNAFIVGMNAGNGSATYDKDIFVDPTGHANFYIFGASQQTVTSPSAIGLGVWVHLVGVSDGSSIKIYVNGVGTSAVAGVSYSGAEHFFIGGTTGSGTPPKPVYPDAQVDEVTRSNVARGPDWIATEYANQSSPPAAGAVTLLSGGSGTLVTHKRTNSFTALASESMGRLAVFGRSDSATALSAESITGVRGMLRAVSDLSMSQVVTRLSRLSRADSAGTLSGESTVRTASFLRADSATGLASEAVSRHSSFARVPADSTAFLTATVRLLSMFRSDGSVAFSGFTVSVVSGSHSGTNYPRGISTGATISEVPAVMRALTRLASDSYVVSEIAARASSLMRLSADSASIVAVPRFGQQLHRSGVDSVALVASAYSSRGMLRYASGSFSIATGATGARLPWDPQVLPANAFTLLASTVDFSAISVPAQFSTMAVTAGFSAEQAPQAFATLARQTAFILQ